MTGAAPHPPRPQRRPQGGAAAGLRALRTFLLGLVLLPAACGPDPGRRSGGHAPVRYDAEGRPIAEGVAPSRRPDVVWVCLDTVRADAFAPWARDEAPMPRSSAWLAERTVTFTEACAPAPWTGPSVASLLTGLLPSAHGARVLAERFTVPTSVTSAAEILAAFGWDTVAYTGGGWVQAGNGMLQGFREPFSPFSFAGEGEAWLQVFRSIRAQNPRFLFFHTYEAHDPYEAAPARLNARKPPPPPVDLAAIDREAAVDGGRSMARRFLLDGATRQAVFGTAFGGPRTSIATRWFEVGFAKDPEGPALAAEARAAYRRGLARLDVALEAWLRGIEAMGLLEDAMLVVTSDHGEGLGEHGVMHHGRRLYDELVHVPLYVRAPGWPTGRRVDAPCSLLDLLPTLLDVVGLPPAKGLDGVSLVPLVLAGERGRPVLAEEVRTGAATGGDDLAFLVSVRDGKQKWIRTTDLRTGTSAEEHYDLVADPGETRRLPAAALETAPTEFKDAVRDARARR